MNSDNAAAVRDSINGCPGVIDAEGTHDYAGAPFETTKRGKEVQISGPYVDLTEGSYRPAYIEEVGEFGHGDVTRPVFVVILAPLPYQYERARSLSAHIVYEIAKHDCSIRWYPADHRFGPAFWIVDHMQAVEGSHDGDRCPECDSTYFKLRDGVPECARCGSADPDGPEQQTLSEVPSQ